MSYDSDKKPSGLSTLTTLENDDTIIVGDTSDPNEVVKTITWANIKTLVSTLIEGLSSYFNVTTNTSDDITEGTTNYFVTPAEKTVIGNTSGTNTGDQDLSGYTSNTDTDVSGNSWVIDEDDMASNSATKVPTQQSVKAYVDNNAGSVDDTAYGAGWNGVTGTAPSKNAVYDEMELKQDILAEGAFVDGDKTKLDGIETGADVTDAVNVGTSIHGATAKATPVDADTLPLIDSAASNVLKKVTWANIKATIKSYYDSVTTTLTNKTIDADNNTLSNIEVDNFKTSAIVTESESIASNDNDTTIPTSAAVKDYVDNNSSYSGSVTISDTEPVSPSEGDIWIDTSEDVPVLQQPFNLSIPMTVWGDSLSDAEVYRFPLASGEKLIIRKFFTQAQSGGSEDTDFVVVFYDEDNSNTLATAALNGSNVEFESQTNTTVLVQVTNNTGSVVTACIGAYGYIV